MCVKQNVFLADRISIVERTKDNTKPFSQKKILLWIFYVGGKNVFYKNKRCIYFHFFFGRERFWRNVVLIVGRKWGLLRQEIKPEMPTPAAPVCFSTPQRYVETHPHYKAWKHHAPTNIIIIIISSTHFLKKISLLFSNTKKAFVASIIWLNLLYFSIHKRLSFSKNIYSCSHEKILPEKPINFLSILLFLCPQHIHSLKTLLVYTA